MLMKIFSVSKEGGKSMPEYSSEKTMQQTDPILKAISNIKIFTENVRIFTNSLEQLLNSIEKIAPTLEKVATGSPSLPNREKHQQNQSLTRADALVYTVSNLKQVTENIRLIADSFDELLNSVENFAPALEVIAKGRNFLAHKMNPPVLAPAREEKVGME